MSCFCGGAVVAVVGVVAVVHPRNLGLALVDVETQS